MARPIVNLLFNLNASDVVCSNPAGDANWLLLATGDYLVWRDGQQASGDLLSGLSYPVVIPETGVGEAPKLFLADYSAGTYKHVYLAGTETGGYYGGNTRYVCAAWFSGATATIPYLEAYDDDTHATWACAALGDGTPANSVFKAVCTTNAAPGSTTWTGTPLAGTASHLALDTAALTTSKYLYWNMKHVTDATMSAWSAADWSNNDLVLTIHYTYA